jgi:hypothetical protein
MPVLAMRSGVGMQLAAWAQAASRRATSPWETLGEQSDDPVTALLQLFEVGGVPAAFRRRWMPSWPKPPTEPAITRLRDNQ